MNDLANAKSGNTDLSYLDDAELQNDRGGLIGRVGHYIDLAVEHGDSSEIRHKLADLVIDYIRTFAPNITHYLPYDTSQPALLEDIEPSTYFHDHVATADGDDIGYDATIYGFGDDTGIGDPTRYFMCAHGGAAFRRFSGVHAYLPASWPEKKGYAAYIDLLKRWCQKIKPAYGTAGLSLLFIEGRQSFRDYLAAFPFAKRYPGLDFPRSDRWYGTLAPKERRVIRTINWLTIIDDGFIEELGGLDRLGATLGPQCDIHPYEGGIIIQAGSKPELGDLNYGEVPKAYRVVAQALKPIRFEEYSGSLLEVPDPLDPIDETLKWVRRFD